MKLLGIIYKRTSPSGKSYIGQTKEEGKRQLRWRNTSIPYTHEGSAIDCARVKYGADNFSYEVLFYTKSSNKEKLSFLLDSMEIYYIKKYNTYKKGYNSTPGGKLLSDKFQIEAKNYQEKISKSVLVYSISGEFLGEYKSSYQVGEKFGIEDINLIRAGASNLYTVTNDRFLIYYKSNFSKEKLDKDLETISKINKYKKVVEYNISTGELINTYLTAKDAMLLTGISSNYIQNCCSGSQISSGGKGWMYEEDYLKIDKKEDLIFEKKSTSKRVVQLTTKGEYLRSFNSITSALNYLGKSNTSASIGICCSNYSSNPSNKSIDTAYGYVWMFENDYNNFKSSNKCFRIKNNREHKGVLQLDLEGNIISKYDSPREIEKLLGFDRSAISKCCRGKKSSYKGYQWKYINE